jgi:hypothetical protein
MSIAPSEQSNETPDQCAAANRRPVWGVRLLVEFRERPLPPAGVGRRVFLCCNCAGGFIQVDARLAASPLHAERRHRSALARLLGESVSDRDVAKSQRVMQAMLKMVKRDIKKLKDAYAGK